MKKIIYLLLVLSTTQLYCQDIEALAKAKPFSISGFVNTGLSYVDDSREDRFTDPLGYFATVGLNFKFYESFNIPISLTYSDQQATFNRPALKMFGASPSYKWITLHAGYRNFEVSPYLMSGSTVKGLGIELTPGIFHLSVFRGNLTHQYNYGYNATEISGNQVAPYNRNSIGGKIGLASGQNFFHMSFLRAADDPISGDFLALDTLDITAKANFGLGFHAGVNLFNVLSINANIAGSALTSNVNTSDEGFDEDFIKLASNIINVNQSTRSAIAYDGEAAVQIKSTRIGFKYQHVDPEYATLGYVFLQQDIDNYTLTYSTALNQSRYILSGNIGWQYTNTNDYFANRDRRVIINSFLSARLTDNLNLSAGYNNFNSEGNLSLVEVVDSLQITTNNSGYTIAANYSFGNKNNRSSLNANVANSKFDLVQGESLVSNNSSANYGLSYSLNQRENGWTFSTRLSYNTFVNIDNLSVSRSGINLGVRKKLTKKFNIRLSPSYDFNYSDGSRDGSVFNIKLRSNYRLTKSTNASFGANYRKRNTTRINPFSQFRTSLSVNTRF